MRAITIWAAIVLAACQTPTLANPVSESPGQPAPITVMVLGAYHFGGSDSDLISVTSDSPLSPRRQGELQSLAEKLAAFGPTLVAVERSAQAPDYIDPVYADFDETMLATTVNERVQIAYRLAAISGVRVVGIDEQPGEGEPDYFPFDRVQEAAVAAGQAEKLDEILGQAQATVEREMSAIKDLSITDALIRVNEGPLSSADFYYALLELDSGENQPGSELNAYWFMRNAKIFAKLLDVAKPGDRIVVVYGAGHKFWLEHLADNTPGIVRADPTDWLRRN